MKNLLFWNQNPIREKWIGRKVMPSAFAIFAISLCALYPTLSSATVESSLAAVQEKLIDTILPMAAMCGLVIAGISFVMGHQNARQHLVYAIIGAIVGFGSESIVNFIRSLIN
jgi:type IV secretory pathway VirB2 component (pilin)